MRIVIMGPPRCGNNWLKCLLSELYDLALLSQIPSDIQGLAQKIESGWFDENSIFHQHFEPLDTIFDLLDSVNARLFTIIRNPYDAFVSLYFFVQNMPQKFGPEHHLHILCDRAIDDSAVLGFLEDTDLGYRVYLQLAYDWMRSQRSYIVRYEELRNTPIRTLRHITRAFIPAPSEKIKEAVQNCQINKMRNMKNVRRKHFRKGKVDDYLNYLTEDHYEIMRNVNGELIQALGYSVV